MNQNFKNINIEDVIFYDLEVVRNSKELDINSKEFELYQKKIRNKETDELPSDTDTVAHYRKFAALKLGYNKIVVATVGKVVKGVLYVRSFLGTEEEILRNLYSKFQSSKYLSGFNILGYDGVISRVNSLKYPGVSALLVEQFNDSGKKEWHLDKVIDLMNVFKGAHWGNSSLDEVCYHLNIPSPKDGGIDGSQVSEIYYTEGVERIEEYCKADVFATVNVFCKLQLKEPFTSYIDANKVETKDDDVKIPLLQRIYKSPQITEAEKEELRSKLSKKKILKKDIPVIEEILSRLYVSTEMFASDKPEIAQRKQKEIQELLNSL